MNYEPDFCTPGNFSNNPSTRVGTTERFRNTADDTRGSGYYGNPWWASDQPYHRHHGWEDNTRFYELQAGRVGMGPPTANLRAEEQARLAQLDIPRSYLDFYPAAAYMGLDGYGPYSDMPAEQNPVRDTPPEPENDNLREHFSNGQEPWYVSAQPWYATNYADDVAYGTYESKRYQPIYRAAAEARTQELGALYNNGDLKSPGIETFVTAAEYDLQGLIVPAWCTGACAARYRRAQGKPEHLVAGTPFVGADKKKRTRVF